MQKLTIKTTQNSQMIDITNKISDIVTSNNIQNGLCIVFVPHTTAAVTINENADPDVVHDILKKMNNIVPHQDNYRHFEGNSAAHIKASMFGFSETVIIKNGKLALGTWQGIYFCEFDGPKSRKVYFELINK